MKSGREKPARSVLAQRKRLRRKAMAGLGTTGAHAWRAAGHPPNSPNRLSGHCRPDCRASRASGYSVQDAWHGVLSPLSRREQLRGAEVADA